MEAGKPFVPRLVFYLGTMWVDSELDFLPYLLWPSFPFTLHFPDFLPYPDVSQLAPCGPTLSFFVSVHKMCSSSSFSRCLASLKNLRLRHLLRKTSCLMQVLRKGYVLIQGLLSNCSYTHRAFEDATLEPQPFDPAANFANTEDSPLQELLLDSSDIWRKETLESCDDVRAFMTTPLIDMLPSGARVRELFLFQCFYLHIDVL
ncbi:hypothetical protein LINPERHAP2_LOCUS6667 [Linum perenne]